MYITLRSHALEETTLHLQVGEPNSVTLHVVETDSALNVNRQ